MSEPLSTPSSAPKTLIPLSYTSLNPAGKSTILLIHGAFSSSQEWDLVTPSLSSTHHVLVPDLPSHGRSSHITPFSVSKSASLLASLIREKAVNGIAHIVGLSLGAHVAVMLASRHPDVVDRVFVSGYGVFAPPRLLRPVLPYVMWAEMRLENLVPRALVAWAMDGAEIRCTDLSVVTVSLCKDIAAPVWGEGERLRPCGAPVLVVVAGKGSWMLPTADSSEAGKALAEVLGEGCVESRAVVHFGCRHPWNRQRPLLFAEAVRVWIEEGETVDGFEPL